MYSGETQKFSLPETAPPVVAVHRSSSFEGALGRNRPHFHPDTFEICTVVRGQLDWFIADETDSVHSSEILLIPPNVVHGAIDSTLQPCEFIAVHFAPEQLPERLAKELSAMPARRFRNPEVSSLVRRIFEAHQTRSPYLEEVTLSLASLLVVAIVESASKDEDQANSRLIRQAKRAMIGKDGARPTVSQVARDLGVSNVWLHKLFVRETGASPGEWARAKQLSEAKRLLESSSTSVAAIARTLGYSTGQSFATSFRKESGMTPSEYREARLSDAQEDQKIFCVDMRQTWVDNVRIYPQS